MISLARLSCSVALLACLVACDLDRADDPARTIVVSGEINHEAVHAFERANDRHPTREDLLAIHRVYIDNEILYREGLKLRHDATATREKVIASALAAIGEEVKPDSVSDAELRHWFESRGAKYRQPARFDFEDATLPGEGSEAAARALAEELNRGAPADPRAALRVFKGRVESNLAQSYGSEVAAALLTSQPGKWLALLTRDGWRAMRLIAMTPPTHAAFEAQRDAIRRDWIAERTAQKRSAAVQSLWSKYQIEFDEAFECLADE